MSGQPTSSMPQVMDRRLSLDENARRDCLLVVEVAQVSTLLGRYLLRFLDAEARQSTELPPAIERDLAERVAAVAVELRARADRRARLGDPQRLIGPISMTDEAGSAWKETA